MAEAMGSKATGDSRTADEFERKITRTLSRGVPLLTLAAALILGFSFGLGMAILALATGALLGAILLFWSSVRTLGGDAPLADGLAVAVHARATTSLEEEKRALLRTLKDLEHEKAIGRLDEHDYQELVDYYRDRAKEVLRAMDEEVAPKREEAEKLVKKHLAKADKAAVVASSEDKVTNAAAPEADRLICDACKTPNEPDATFCKKCGAKVGGANA